MVKNTLQMAGGLFLLVMSTISTAGPFQVYGVVDLGIESINAIPSESISSGTIKRMQSGYESGSRVGFRTSEEVGAETKVIVVLETGVEADTGRLSQGGRLFGRQAFVSYESQRAGIKFGRQLSLLYDFDLQFDPTGIRYSSPMLDLAYNGRFDNSIKAFYSNSSSQLNFFYALGNEMPEAKRVGQVYSVSYKTNLGKAILAGIAERQYGSTILTRDFSVDRYAVGIVYKFNENFSIYGALGKRSTNMPAEWSAANGWLGLLWKPTSPLLLSVALYAQDPKGTDSRSLGVVLYGTYFLSSKLDFYCQIGMVKNETFSAMGVNGPATAISGKDQTALATGIRYRF